MKPKKSTSTLLKLKAILYKYTGIYLAHREENDFLQSDECWKQLIKIASKKKNGMSPRNAQGLMIGMWQAEHGFSRPMSRLRFFTYRFKYPRLKPLLSLADGIVTFCVVIKYDIQKLIRKIKKPS